MERFTIVVYKIPLTSNRSFPERRPITFITTHRGIDKLETAFIATEIVGFASG